MNPYEPPTTPPEPNVAMEVVADMLIDSGVSRFYAAPFPYRILWKFGWQATTPVFASMIPYCLISGTICMAILAPVLYGFGYRPLFTTAIQASSTIAYPIACGYWYQIQKARKRRGLTTLHHFTDEQNLPPTRGRFEPDGPLSNNRG